jgi:ribonuclease G
LYGIRQEEHSRTGPIENAYGDIHAGSSAEPIILPGESLSKYRKAGEEPAAEVASKATTAASSASLTPLAAPATLYTAVAQGWDGSDVLPGETLSRRRAPQQRTERPVKAAPVSDLNQPTVESSTESGAKDAPAPAPAEEGAAPAGPEAADVPPVLEGNFVEEVEETEYEPEAASASFRVDPVPPREFRNVPTMEPPAEFASEFAAEPREPAVADRCEQEYAEPAAHDITSVSATGEMLSEPELQSDDVAASGTMERADETSPIHHEHAVLAAETIDSDAAIWPVEVSSEGEAQQDEEPITTTLHASSIEEIEDEEETLEGAADLGVMLREMSIDQITRGNSEQDEFEEDSLEEIEEYQNHREFAEAQDDTSVQGVFQDTSVEDEFDDSEAAFAEEEPRGADAVAGEPTPQRREGDRRGRRDGRDGRRGRGERHGHGHGHGNGRTRQSAQSTNLPVISDLLKPGQEILVQIAKEPIAKKGARITSHIALPGRFLVFMPTVNHTGVSRKIESDAERRRLKDILLSEKGEASGGFIVRTAAEGASEDELRSDLRFLLNLWSDIKSRSESSKSPALIYHDLNLIERILRDQVTDNFSAIWVDTETEYERVLRFLQRFQPSLIRRVKLYSKETPLFEQFGITDEINKALKSKVWLKSGGSIVINQTEALVAIDINTGKFVGKTARLEDTIVKTNLDAIPEIVRQIRLRDLGGIIIIDFIDMDERKNRNRVMAALEEELKKDRAPSKVLQFNDFGLVAITRKRVKQSLERTLSVTCSVCSGTGMVKSPITVCNDIYVEMRKMQRHLDRGDVMLRVHPEVVKQLKASGARWLQEMEDMVGKTILVKSDPSLHPEQFDIH